MEKFVISVSRDRVKASDDGDALIRLRLRGYN